MYAYEFIARDKAGLALCGVDEEGNWEWVGSFQDWQKVDRLEREIVNETVD